MKEAEIKKGEFFNMSLETVRHLVKEGAGAEEVIAYLVLCRGTNAISTKRVSSHGAKSVSERGGFSYRRAVEAIAWLEKNMVVVKKVPENSPVPKKLQPKWELVSEGEDLLYLPNSLIDGLKGISIKSPLCAIYEDLPLGSSCIIADTRLDALMVLFHLYKHDDFAGCGGIDPRKGIYKAWTSAEGLEDYFESVTPLEGTNASLFQIEADTRSVFHTFANEALFYIADEAERFIRFWEAFNNLQRESLVYEVTQIWNADPNGKEGRKAEPLYTLYVHNKSARDSEPYLQECIHRTLIRIGEVDREYFFHDDFSFKYSGKFRYIAATKHKGFPLGIYRLKFRPKTKDYGLGFAAEKKRVGDWQFILSGLRELPFNQTLDQDQDEGCPF